MIVYRIEGSDGDGPYSGYGTVACDVRGAHQDRNHPSPWGDGIEDFNEYEDYCGTSTMERLIEWFSGVMPLLRGSEYQDYFIARYEVPVDRVKFGVLQLVFDRSASTLLGKVPV